MVMINVFYDVLFLLSLIQKHTQKEYISIKKCEKILFVFDDGIKFKIDMSGIDHPMKIKEIPKFEKQNKKNRSKYLCLAKPKIFKIYTSIVHYK